MGAKIDGDVPNEERKNSMFLKENNKFSEFGGIGAGAELGDQFTISQQVKTEAQLALLENALDIKVGTINMEKYV